VARLLIRQHTRLSCFLFLPAPFGEGGKPRPSEGGKPGPSGGGGVLESLLVFSEHGEVALMAPSKCQVTVLGQLALKFQPPACFVQAIVNQSDLHSARQMKHVARRASSAGPKYLEGSPDGRK